MSYFTHSDKNNNYGDKNNSNINNKHNYNYKNS